MLTTLANTPLDLQIKICIFLHPSDILALRRTCKALEFATRKRIVWMAALHQVCLDNILFLPSFPIPDMSDLELEQAAIGPRRWIEHCGAFHKQDHDESQASDMLRPRTTRIIEDASATHSFIAPGGRYLVTASNCISVWDLSYISTVDCKLIDSLVLPVRYWCQFLVVQVSQDGKGLVILSSYNPGYHLSIFEIYPQSEKPLLTEIARLDWGFSTDHPPHLLPDTLICRAFYGDRIIFRVVDYRTNYSTCFTADVQRYYSDDVETFATKTAIIVFSRQGILIFAIPPLSSQPSYIFDCFRGYHSDPTHILPLFKIPLPDGIVRHNHEIYEWKTVSSWYFESWGDSVYFDIFYEDSKLQRFKIIIKPDLSDASLHFINRSEINWKYLPDRVCEGYRICDDALVYFWSWENREVWGASCNGLTSTSLTSVITRCDGDVVSLCPTSGRFVYFTYSDTKGPHIVVVDLFR